MIAYNFFKMNSHNTNVSSFKYISAMFQGDPFHLFAMSLDLLLPKYLGQEVEVISYN